MTIASLFSPRTAARKRLSSIEEKKRYSYKRNHTTDKPLLTTQMFLSVREILTATVQNGVHKRGLIPRQILKAGRLDKRGYNNRRCLFVTCAVFGNRTGYLRVYLKVSFVPYQFHPLGSGGGSL